MASGKLGRAQLGRAQLGGIKTLPTTTLGVVGKNCGEHHIDVVHVAHDKGAIGKREGEHYWNVTHVVRNLGAAGRTPQDGHLHA